MDTSRFEQIQVGGPSKNGREAKGGKEPFQKKEKKHKLQLSAR